MSVETIYESVDEKSLSLAMSLETAKKRIHAIIDYSKINWKNTEKLQSTLNNFIVPPTPHKIMIKVNGITDKVLKNNFQLKCQSLKIMRRFFLKRR